MTILYSENSQMTNGNPLDRATVGGVVYIYAEDLPTDTDMVTWQIDGIPHRDNDANPPWTLNPNTGSTAGAYNLNELTEKEHWVCLKALQPDGTYHDETAKFMVEHEEDVPVPQPPPAKAGRGPGGNIRPPYTPAYSTPATARAGSLSELNAALANAGPGDCIEVTASIGGSGPGGAKLFQAGGDISQNVLVRPPLGKRLSFTPAFASGANFITVAGFSAACWLQPGTNGFLKRSGLWRATGDTGYMGFYGRTEDCFIFECVVKKVQTGSDPCQVKADVGDVVRPLIAQCWFAGAVRSGTSHTDIIQFVGYNGFGEVDPTVRGVVSGPSASGVIQHAEIKGMLTFDNCWFDHADGRTINGGGCRPGFNAGITMRDTDLNGGANFPNSQGVNWRNGGIVNCNAATTIVVNGATQPDGNNVGSRPALPSSPWGSEVPL